jgi:ribonuclease HII
MSGSALVAYDRALGVRMLAGADETGRAPWAGPFVAAAVLFDLDRLETGRGRDLFEEMRDSKDFKSPTKLARLAEGVHEHASTFAVVAIPAAEINQIGVDEANRLCLEGALHALGERPELRLVDGDGRLKLSASAPAHETILGGDGISATIAAASIVAKVACDRIMDELHTAYPEYGFDSNRGYCSPAHSDALGGYGLTPAHRLNRGTRPYLDVPRFYPS